MAEIWDFEKKNIKKHHENNLGGACKNGGMLISSVNTIEPSANLVATIDGDSHSNKLFTVAVGPNCFYGSDFFRELWSIFQ